jgi:hypothetical protein
MVQKRDARAHTSYTLALDRNKEQLEKYREERDKHSIEKNFKNFYSGIN